MKKQYYFIFIIFISFFIFNIHHASAANVSFNVPSSTEVGQNLDMVVNADTGGILINSVELNISYDANLLSFTGYSDDNAIVKIWIDPPHTTTDGEISLSGIIPGGVSGLYEVNKIGLSPIPLVHLLFDVKKEGTANFSFSDSKILQDDGVGTPLLHEDSTASVIIKGNPNGENTIPNTTQNIKNISTNRTNSLYSPDAIFWVVIIILMGGFLGYKLIKYKV